jgi:hypothetical protein
MKDSGWISTAMKTIPLDYACAILNTVINIYNI